MTGLLKASRQQKGHRNKTVALTLSAAVAALATGQISHPGHAAATSNIADPIVTASIAPVQVPHELRIELTPPGTEALDLAARLHELGGLITRPIDWTVKRLEIGISINGSVVYKKATPVAETSLEPGKYLVEAAYGYHKVVHPLTILPGQRIGVTLILNVGGIRALSTVQHTDLPTSIDARHAIYALSGPNRGRLIVDKAGQGDVLRLAAGTYRVESRFSPGNTVAESTVTVKSGILSSLEVAHKAGLVRITVGTDRAAAVAWEIRSLSNSWSRNHTKPATAMVLAPGRYRITAIVNGTTVVEEFANNAGENRHVRLGFK